MRSIGPQAAGFIVAVPGSVKDGCLMAEFEKSIENRGLDVWYYFTAKYFAVLSGFRPFPWCNRLGGHAELANCSMTL
ncbi:hypothetical protein Avi_1683 [Allorhizobium ampelinum S4]|uniref:Uncharacterized protein n=2 Tax=Rhizobium/Agrobacterium group TaxID=227290 RepID=B9JVC6_ALLAM|nr:hypothetical protein Avi_1683 [Allorhizobium ampelinum S4]